MSPRVRENIIRTFCNTLSKNFNFQQDIIRNCEEKECVTYTLVRKHAINDYERGEYHKLYFVNMFQKGKQNILNEKNESMIK